MTASRGEGTIDRVGTLHPRIRAAGERGELPEWAACSAGRREHAKRVASLMGQWAERLELPETDRLRWRAAAVLHDALRDAPEPELRRRTDAREADDRVGRDTGVESEPAALLHGPACAARLREEGVRDEELLGAVAWHTLGHPGLGELGRFLYLADFLEPGRSFLPEVRERIRRTLPGEAREALLSVVALRIAHRLEARGPIRWETVAFWNRLLEGAGSDGPGGAA